MWTIPSWITTRLAILPAIVCGWTQIGVEIHSTITLFTSTMAQMAHTIPEVSLLFLVIVLVRSKRVIHFSTRLPSKAI